MEWTDGRWLHPSYLKCIKLFSKMNTKLSLTQRDGSRKSLDWQRESERSPCARPWQSKNQTRKKKMKVFHYHVVLWTQFNGSMANGFFQGLCWRCYLKVINYRFDNWIPQKFKCILLVLNRLCCLVLMSIPNAIDCLGHRFKLGKWNRIVAL